MKDIYFTQLASMNLQEFLFHAGIAAVIFFINGLWGFVLGKRTLSEAHSRMALESQVSNIGTNIKFANDISNGNLNIDYNIAASDDLGKALVAMRENLVTASTR